MTPLLHNAVLVAASSSSKSKSGGSSLITYGFIIIIILAGYFLIIRPRGKARRVEQARSQNLEIGSEVMSVGGIMGTIVGMTDTTYDVTVANGVTLTFVQRAIKPRPEASGTAADPDMPPDPWDAPPEDLESGDGGQHDGLHDEDRLEDGDAHDGDVPDEDGGGEGGQRPGRS